MHETALLEMHHKELFVLGGPNDTSPRQVAKSDVAGRPTLALKCETTICVSAESDDRPRQTS